MLNKWCLKNDLCELQNVKPSRVYNPLLFFFLNKTLFFVTRWDKTQNVVVLFLFHLWREQCRLCKCKQKCQNLNKLDLKILSDQNTMVFYHKEESSFQLYLDPFSTVLWCALMGPMETGGMDVVKMFKVDWRTSPLAILKLF